MLIAEIREMAESYVIAEINATTEMANLMVMAIKDVTSVICFIWYNGSNNSYNYTGYNCHNSCNGNDGWDCHNECHGHNVCWKILILNKFGSEKKFESKDFCLKVKCRVKYVS